jgi:predicted metal-dependent phosphoesterase TrpH
VNNPNRIRFEKPDLENLNKQYAVVDMHFHTRYSDGRNSVRAIANRVRKMNIGIGITDHNEIRGAVEMDAYKDVLNIPGIEITSREGAHLLVYFYRIDDLVDFYKKDIRPRMGEDVMSALSLPMMDIIQKARAFETLMIFPHPYCAVYTGICNPTIAPEDLQRLFREIDGVEVINASNLNRWNLRCTILGFNLDKSITGGSDGHTLSHLGKSVSYALCKRNRKDFLNAVKKKRSKVIGKEIDIIRKLTSNGFKFKSRLKQYPDLMEKNIRYSYTVINSKSKTIKESVKRRIYRRRRNSIVD